MKRLTCWSRPAVRRVQRERWWLGKGGRHTGDLYRKGHFDGAMSRRIISSAPQMRSDWFIRCDNVSDVLGRAD